MSVVLLGATGLVGSSVLSSLLKSQSIKKVTTLTRSAPDVSGAEEAAAAKLKAVVTKNIDEWFTKENLAGYEVAISAFGTTRAAAGSLEAFVKIDKGTNVEFAKQCKANGASTFVLVSSWSANPKSWFPYLKTKGEIEKEITDLGFQKVVILRPGVLLGDRKVERGFLTRAAEFLTAKLANTPLNALSQGVNTVKLGQLIANLVENGPKDGVTIIDAPEIVKLTKNL